MRGDAQNGLTIVVGVTALRLSLTDVYLRYVKESLRPYLIVAGVLLVVIGVAGLVRDSRRRAEGEPIDDDAISGDLHEHDDHTPRVAWLLLLPVLAIFLISPASLGAFAARRSDVRLTAPKAKFPSLNQPVNGAIPMSLREFSLRSYYDDEKSLQGKRVRLVGFVTTEGGRLLLTRFQLSCCAADGVAIKVRLEDFPGTPPAADTWLEVVGEYAEPDRDEDGEPIVTRPARLVVDDVQRIPQPKQPYET